ncbi:MAG: hypothetical protein ACFE95_06640 [Candidatus Hodarchaeota archaeon]
MELGPLTRRVPLREVHVVRIVSVFHRRGILEITTADSKLEVLGSPSLQLSTTQFAFER